jgi:hypothetical protein
MAPSSLSLATMRHAQRLAPSLAFRSNSLAYPRSLMLICVEVPQDVPPSGLPHCPPSIRPHVVDLLQRPHEVARIIRLDQQPTLAQLDHQLPLQLPGRHDALFGLDIVGHVRRPGARGIEIHVADAHVDTLAVLLPIAAKNETKSSDSHAPIYRRLLCRRSEDPR